MAVTGTLEVDGHAVGNVALALVADDGTTLAVTRSDPAGRFSFPRSAAPSSWVIAKLHEPVVGAVAARATTDGSPVLLTSSTASCATLAADIALPPGADPVAWFDVSVTPTSQDGIPVVVLRTLTLDGVGPARTNAYHKLRVQGSKLHVRVLPGGYDLHVAHVIERPKSPPPSPTNWISDRATLRDGTVVAADLGYFAVDLHHDLELRVTMVPARD
jgi:hypothetical protein